jgi:hypothetical protein
MRGIQYAAASRLYHWRLGILDRPLSRAMTAESVARDDRIIRSLRANGSREGAPDDRLREAIHLAMEESKKVWIASLRSQ